MLTVVHSTNAWLAPTKTWIHSQIVHLPPDVRSHVATPRLTEPERFPVRHLHVAPRSRSRAVYERLVRATGVRRLELWRLGLTGPAPHLTRVVRATGAAVVHSHFGDQAVADRPAVRRTGARHVVTFYGQDLSLLPRSQPEWRDRYAQLFSEVDKVLVEGPHMRDTLTALGCPPAKSAVQHLGVDLARLPFRPRTRADGAPLRVLVCGTFREKKGIPDAIEATARFARQSGAPVELTVVGDAGVRPSDQAEKARVLDAVARSGLDVRMPGFLGWSDLMELAYAHHVFLSPSRTAPDGDDEGGAPVTILELAATGMPVVSTTHCDIPNALPAGQAALLAPEGDVEALAGLLAELATDGADWGPLVRAARARLERDFDVARQGPRLAAVYHQLAG